MSRRNKAPLFLQSFTEGWPFIDAEPAEKTKIHVYGFPMELYKLGHNYYDTDEWRIYISNVFVSMQPICGSFTVSSRDPQCGDFELNYGMACEIQFYVHLKKENVVIRVYTSVANNELYKRLRKYDFCKLPGLELGEIVDRVHKAYLRYKDKIISDREEIRFDWVQRKKAHEAYMKRKDAERGYTHRGGYIGM